MGLLATTATPVLAHMVEAAQFAAFVGGVVAVDIALLATFAAHVHGLHGALGLLLCDLRSGLGGSGLALGRGLRRGLALAALRRTAHGSLLNSR